MGKGKYGMNKTTKCRVCGGETSMVQSLGSIYPSTFIKSPDEYDNLKKEFLDLVQCEDCGLIQLDKTIELDGMYRQYWYRSGLNKSMVNDLKNVSESVLKIHNYGKTILDIGCNDGTLFKFFPDNYFKIGIDPAYNLIENAEKNCDIFINDYFKAEYIDRKIDIITSIAMFYDLPDPNSFVSDIHDILAFDGVWVIQFTDLYSMLKANAFDNICHEHLEYYTLLDVIILLKKCSLEVFNAETNDVNGGSLRIYVGHYGQHEISPSVLYTLVNESSFLRSKDGSINAFRERIKNIKRTVVSFIKEKTKDGKVIYGMGASTKGNTLLQYFRLDNELIKYIAEINEDKFGLYTVGSNIEIISEEQALKDNPDYMLCLPWHFEGNFITKLKDYLNKGGKLIFPLPIPKIIDRTGAKYL